METTMSTRVQWTAQPTTKKSTNSLAYKWNTFVNSQTESKTLWFLVSLVFQGVFFLPVPAFLIYYFNAPILVLVVTLTLFFANIIAGMGGAGIKTLLTLFAASIALHVLMLIAFII
ncbi:hypothetical protein [Mucilaginibacter ginsenosidivorax]|uniref:Uncharacterized protein n=1 Tax=Mucilaginibacter ginsenosidivorax TaxID=862126 RepID=A0A5B8W6Q4_9SPHI|nr:hypothetical protein [Mucilaginibacter ginsenosidivorax]QEC79554.1 hypothetical protein FSB76_27725 [Mucilaginibacter ginsenosidivorax]